MASVAGGSRERRRRNKYAVRGRLPRANVPPLPTRHGTHSTHANTRVRTCPNAQVGFMAGKEAVKTIVPAAGKVAVWAVQQGTRAAFGAAQKRMQRGLPDGGAGRRNGKGSPGDEAEK